MSELVKELVDGPSFYEAVVAAPIALVDFWAPWCAPCRMMAPILEKLASEMPNVSFMKLNVDDTDVSEELGIRGIPLFVLFKDGQEIARTTGSRSQEAMRDWITSALG